MTPVQQLLAVFGTIALILIIATLIGRTLAAQQAADAPSAVIENLNARIDAWWAMVALIGLAFIFGDIGVVVLFGLLSFAGLREFITLTRTRSGDYWALLIAFFIAIPVQYYLIYVGWYGLYSILIPVYAFLLMPILSVFRAETTNFLERVAEVQWGLMISVFCLSHVPALLRLEIPGYEGESMLLIVYLVIVTQSSDVLQYIWGKLLGKHKIAPRLSPSKTIEGFVGGVLSASAIGALLWWITPFTIGQSALLALTIALMGFFGGLVMSAIKRDRGVKDWGWSIQGHGGILDRLDSVIFAAPIFFHMVRFGWAI
jgi:phosphatidate cytidylyltransferase